MKKKGFTLIELLAVIVILAIIALISIPVVTNMINNAKKSAAKSSALGYIEAVNNNNGFADIGAEGYTKIDDGVHNVSTLTIKTKGKKPDSGDVTVSSGRVITASLCINGYSVTYANNNATVGSKCGSSDSSASEPVVFSKGNSIFYNPKQGKACDSLGGDCMRFYVITTDDDATKNTIKVISAKNVTDNISYSDVETELNGLGWKSDLNPELISIDEIKNIVENTDYDYMSDDILYFDDEYTTFDNDYWWLFNNTSECLNYGCKRVPDEDAFTYGYWTSVSLTSEFVGYVAWAVAYNGSVLYAPANENGILGIRPVITISKEGVKIAPSSSANTPSEPVREEGAYLPGDEIIMNPKTGGECTAVGGDCMKFYVISTNDTKSNDKVKVILDHNLSATIDGDIEDSFYYTNEYGWSPIGDANDALTYMTKGWKGNPELISMDEIASIIGMKDYSSLEGFYFDGHDGTDEVQDTWMVPLIQNTGGISKYWWLFDYTNQCTYYGCKNDENKINAMGYWAKTTLSDDYYGIKTWAVSGAGGAAFVYLDQKVGIRPVVTISKNGLKTNPSVTPNTPSDSTDPTLNLTMENPDSYTNGLKKIVYYNPTGGNFCKKGELGTNGCMKWYAYEEDSSTYTMILDHNLSDSVVWMSNQDDVSPITGEKQLDMNTAGWKGARNTYPRFISADEIAKITEADTKLSWSSETANRSIYLDGGVSGNWYYQTARDRGASRYWWLFDNTNNCKNYGCRKEYNNTSGYYTDSFTSDKSVWGIDSRGSLNFLGINNTMYGIRPVITISKTGDNVEETKQYTAVTMENPDSNTKGLKKIVYFNPVTGKLCDKKFSGINNCMKWYAYDEDTSSYTAILDHNTTAKIAWNSTGKTTNGVSEAKMKLNSDTSSWLGLSTIGKTIDGVNYRNYRARLITADEIASITEHPTFNGLTSSYSARFYLDTNTSTRNSSINGAGKSEYWWLFDNTNQCLAYGCRKQEIYNITLGYWTSTPINGKDTAAWYLSSSGFLNSDAVVSNASSYGIRPVITIPKP